MSPMPEKQNVEETGVVRTEQAAAAAAEKLNPVDAARQRQEELLDEALEESFPASDPVSVVVVDPA